MAWDKARLEVFRQEASADAGAVKTVSDDLTALSSIACFSDQLSRWVTQLSGVVLMPPRCPPAATCCPNQSLGKTVPGPLFRAACLAAGLDCRHEPDPAIGRRRKIVIVSGIASMQVLRHYARNNVIPAAWLAQGKTLAFALGSRGIHVNALSLGGTLLPHYIAMIQKRADDAGQDVETRLATESENVPLAQTWPAQGGRRGHRGALSDFSDHLTGANIIHDGGFTRTC